MFGIDTGIDSSLYEAVLVVHILLSIAGFGAVLLNGVHFAQAKQRLGREGQAISEANLRVSGIAEVLILAVPASGLALVWAADGAWSLDDLWVWNSLALFAVAFAISRGVLAPTHRRATRILGELDGTGTGTGHETRLAELDRAGATMARAGAVLDLLLVAIVILMITKPVG